MRRCISIRSIRSTLPVPTALARNQVDFVAVVIHELGHALGFDSGEDEVDAGVKQVQLSPIDMFRLAPGQGARISPMPSA